MLSRHGVFPSGAALLALLALSCGGSGQGQEPVVRPVKCARAVAANAVHTRSFTGTAQADLESKLSFKVAGTIGRISVKVGDRVSRGQLLAELDPKDYRLKVREAEAGLDRARAVSRNAGAVYERIQALYAEGHVSRNDLDAARSGAESAASAVRASEQLLELARSQLGYARLESPVNGSVAAVIPQENENIAAGYPVILLTSGALPEVKVAVPENLIGGVRRGAGITVRFPAIPGREFTGTVQEVGIAVTGPFTTYPVIVRLTEADPEIRSGMAAEAMFRFEKPDDARAAGVCVPPQAVGEDTRGRFAYVVERTSGAEGVAHRRAVTTGEISGEGLEVLSGLADGDLVVTAGISRMEDGLRVKLPREGDRP